jgi:hypothetical protein
MDKLYHLGKIYPGLTDDVYTQARLEGAMNAAMRIFITDRYG